MESIYDIAVVGAGPAGSTIARILAGRGAAVLLLDKAVFPRPKPCAGGVSPKAIRHLPFDIDAGIGTRISKAILSYQCLEEVVCSSPGSLGWTVERELFDALLLEKAVSAGVRFMDRARVSKVRWAGGHWEIDAAGNTFRSRFLVGADGTASIIARSLGVPRPQQAPCIEARVRVPAEQWEKAAGVVKFDFGQVESGYAWVFAKSDDFSVGIYSTRFLSGRALRRNLEAFVSREPMVTGGKITHLRRWFVPRGAPWRRKIHFNSGLLVGDAAGLADPLTGEGIRQALHSAELASDVLAESLEAPHPSLGRYSKEIDAVLRPGFRIARVCAAVAFRSKGRLVGRFVRSGLGQGSWGNLARGDIPYPKLSWRLLAFAPWLPWRAAGHGSGKPRESRE